MGTQALSAAQYGLNIKNGNNNSIHVYLRANLTAWRPITKLA
jgi:hypothetical protein